MYSDSIEENEKEMHDESEEKTDHPVFVEEFEIEEMSVDGICGVY